MSSKDLVSNIIKGMVRWSFSANNPEGACDFKRVLTEFQRKAPHEHFTPVVYDEQPPMTIGVAIHKFIELYENHCYESGKDRDFDGAEIIIGKVIGDMLLPLSMQEDFISLARSFYEDKIFNLDYEVKTEFKVSVKLQDGVFVACDWDDPEVCARSIIDRCLIPKSKLSKSNPVFIDYKSNRVCFGVEDNHKIAQLKFNAVLYRIFTNHSFNRCLLVYDFVRNKKQTAIEFVVDLEEKRLMSEILSSLERTKNCVESCLADIDNMPEDKDGIIEFVSRYFKPRQNNYCGCSFISICPIYKKAIQFSELTNSEESGEAAGNQAEVFNKKRKIALQHLKNLYKKNGPVKVGKKFYGKFREENKVFLTEKLVKDIIYKSFDGNSERHEIISSILEYFKDLEIKIDGIREKMKGNDSFKEIAEKSCEDGAYEKWEFVDADDFDSTKWI